MASTAVAEGRVGRSGPPRGARLVTGVATTLLALVVAAPAVSADDIRSAQWHLGFLNVEKAHQISKGAGVTVAVVDSGVQADHPDLVGNVLPGKDFLDGTDGRGDENGHGTGMASLIAGHGHGTGDGVLGVAPEAKVLPIRVDIGGTYASTIGRAIRWATDHGAEIINVSLGVYKDPVLRRAVRYAQQQGALIVASGGNSFDGRTYMEYPALYPGVIAVSAVDEQGEFAGNVSVQGEAMDLAAPGVDIVSAANKDGYARGKGTSSASALVSGAAALVWSKYPELGAKGVARQLRKTVNDKGPRGRDPKYGSGVIDPVKALTAPVPGVSSTSPAAQESPAAASGSQGSGFPLGWILGGGLVLVVLVVGAAVAFWVISSRSRRRPAGNAGGHPPTPQGPPGPPPGGQPPPQWPRGR